MFPFLCCLIKQIPEKESDGDFILYFPHGSLWKYLWLWGNHWVSEESFWKPKRNSTEEKLVQSQYNGTRINMIHRDRGSHWWRITSNAENLCAFFRGPYLMLYCLSLLPQKLPAWLKQVASISRLSGQWQNSRKAGQGLAIPFNTH